MKPCKHFSIEELTPPGHQNWSLLDEQLCDTLDELHDLLTKQYVKHGHKLVMRVNTWANGGKFKYRGWRPQQCATGSQRSQHKLGKGADFEAFLVDLGDGSEQEIDPEEIRGHLRRWKLLEGKLKYLGGMETGITWNHVDVRGGGESLIQFKG
jgi:hypothetical protein